MYVHTPCKLEYASLNKLSWYDMLTYQTTTSIDRNSINTTCKGPHKFNLTQTVFLSLKLIRKILILVLKVYWKRLRKVKKLYRLYSMNFIMYTLSTFIIFNIIKCVHNENTKLLRINLHTSSFLVFIRIINMTWWHV